MELLGRYSNQEDLVETLLRLNSLPRTGQKRQEQSRPKQEQTRLSPNDIDRLIELYQAGKAINDLATEFNIHRTTVMKQVERAGQPPRRGGIFEHLDEARELYEQGWSLAKVGQHLGFDAETVRQAFRKAGMPRRPRRRWNT